MRQNPIYGFCIVIFPIFAIIFFTSLMNQGVPEKLPVGVVDLDNTTTSRAMIRTLDGFQTSHVVAHYNNVNEARQAIQQSKIYAFLLIPKGTTSGIMNGTQPKISFYYSNISLVAGSMLYRDLKIVSSLGSAAVAATKLAAIGKTNREIKEFLQPITIDLHMINNPWANYNIYLSTTMVPGIIMIFIFLLTPYTLGTELKFKRSKELFKMADGNMFVALIGKLLPQTIMFITIFYAFYFYIFQILGFPHPGGVIPMLLLGALSVLACQGFGIFAFSMLPSLRMSMSICSLWAVIGFSAAGATYPVFAMDGALQTIAELFPLRHYYMIYQITIFNGFPLIDAWLHIMALVIFAFLPFLSLRNLRKAMLIYEYIP